MTNPTNPDHQGPAAPMRWRDFVKLWWELIPLIAGAVTAILASLIKAEGLARIIGLLVALILIAISGYVLRRIQRKQHLRKQRQQQLALWEKRKQKRTAFRGLYPFGEEDVLPGEHRQREARVIFTRVTDVGFSFGLICGDVGCGKTSLLRSAVQNLLREAGFAVIYVAAWSELHERSTSRAKHNGHSRLQRELRALDKRIKQASHERPVILLIDQFEEFFIEYLDADQRGELGAFVSKLTKAVPSVKVLAAIRRDYLIDVQELAPQLASPISSKTLFPLKNFSEEEAASIIGQCAEMDRLTVDGDFPRIIACDLAEGGCVRPPELQIVCGALAGMFTIPKYRLAGGAKGILSNHIKEAISISGDPNIARRILRALCDFPSSVKNDPQPFPLLVRALGLSHNLRSGESQVREIFEQLEAARIVVSETHLGEFKYSLIHDYLVDAVAAATSDVSTRTEEAHQLLYYYLSGIRSDAKSRIPLFKLRFIRKNADPKMLVSPQVKRLMRRSIATPVITSIAIVTIVLAATGGIYAFVTARRTWKGEEVARHWAVGVRNDFTTRTLLGNSLLLTSYTEDKTYLRLWDTKSAKMLLALTCEEFVVSPHGDYVIIAEKENTPVYALHVLTKTRYPLGLTYSGKASSPEFNESGNVISYFEVTKSSGDEYRLSLRVWSIVEQREIGAISGFQLGQLNMRQLTKGADRIVLLCLRGSQLVPALWDVQAGKLLGYLVKGTDTTSVDFSISEEQSVVATFEANPEGALAIALWDLRTGKPIRSRTISNDQEKILSEKVGKQLEQKLLDIKLYFVANGERLLIDQDSGEPLMVFNTSDLLQSADIPNDLRWLASPDGHVHYIAWSSNSSDDVIWETRQNIVRRITSLNFPTFHDDEPVKDTLLVHYDGDHALLFRKSGQIELWSLIKGQRIKELTTHAKSLLGGFSLEGHAVYVRLEDGAMALYSIDTGEMIADIPSAGGYLNTLAYNESCHEILMWTNEGRVLRYREGNEVLGRWFHPFKRCND
jgi:WD40 repeat protein